jgi:hypothetical protein
MTTTKTTIALAELAEKGADVDLVREMIGHIAQRMMDMDARACARRRTGREVRSA